MNKQFEYLKAMNKLYELEIPEHDMLQAETELKSFEKAVEGSQDNIKYCFGCYKEYAVGFGYDHNKKETKIILAKDNKPKFMKTYQISSFYLDFVPNTEDLNRIIKLLNTGYGNSEKIFRNMEELKSYVLDNNINDLNHDDLNLLFWLTGTKERKIKKYHNEHFKKIVLVIEKDNRRFYAVSNTASYGLEYDIKVVKPENEDYNYIDEGRLVYNDVFIDELSENELNIDILDFVRRNSSFDILNKSRYDIMKIKKKEEDDLKNAKKSFDEILAKRLKESIMHNNIKLTTNFIEYEGLKIGSPDFDIIGFIRTYVDFEKDIDFNILFDNFCNYVITVNDLVVDETKQVEVFLGKYSIRLRKEVKKRIKYNYNGTLTDNPAEEPTKEENKSTKYLVEGVRINKEEIPEVLKRCLCYSNRVEFVFFLKEISECSIKLHRILACGLRVPLEEGDETKTLKFNITRKDKRNYLVYNNKLFRIKNSNSFFSKENLKHYNRINTEEMIKYLIENFEMNGEDAIGVLKEALKEYGMVIKRSEEYLQRAIKATGAEKATVDINNETVSGYIVKGKLNAYFLTDDLKVYRQKDLKYLCIVDADLDNQIKNDRLARRLRHLSNDRFFIDIIKNLDN